MAAGGERKGQGAGRPAPEEARGRGRETVRAGTGWCQVRLCIPKAKTSPQTSAPQPALPRLAASPSSTGQSLGGREIKGSIHDLPGLEVTSHQVKGGQGQHRGGSQACPTAVSAGTGGGTPTQGRGRAGEGERASQGLAGGAPTLLPPAPGRQQGHLLVQTEQGCRRAPLLREGPLQGREHPEPEKHRELTSTTAHGGLFHLQIQVLFLRKGL